jgi:hypothetical protein
MNKIDYIDTDIDTDTDTDTDVDIDMGINTGIDKIDEIDKDIIMGEKEYIGDTDVSMNNINFIPSEVKINNGKELEYFKITKYINKIDNYDIKKDKNEIVFPLRLYNFPMDNTFLGIDIEMAIIFLSNAINKINIKHNKPVIKSLRREDMILVDLVSGNIKRHRDGLYMTQNLYPFIGFRDPNEMKTENLTIFIPICIVLENTSGHFNILVINNNNKTITLYEPYGIQGVGNIDKLSEIHRSRFRKTLKYIQTEVLKDFPNYKLIVSHNDYDGIQYRSDMYTRKVFNIPENFCVAWCLYVCLFRIFNMHLDTDIPASIILNQIYTNYFSDSDLNIFIRHFVSMIREDTDNYQSDIFSIEKSEFLGYETIQNIDNI